MAFQISTLHTFSPSIYQTGLFEFVAEGKGSAIVVAVAGSGKTTSVINSLLYIPEYASVKIVAFNTLIAKELKERIAALRTATGRAMRNFDASTFHSLGFGVIRKHLESRGVRMGEPNSNKLRELVRSYMSKDDQALYGAFVCKLVGLARGEGIGVLTADTFATWESIVAHHDLSLDSDEAEEGRAIELSRDLLRRSNDAALLGNIDFDDMLYCVILWKLRPWQNDFVFVDEAQDTNPVRRALIKLALKPGGRLIAVGDPKQAIYGFTGASADAMDLIKREFACKELPLTVSYRCDAAIVERAKALVPYLEAAPGAAQGKVEVMGVKAALAALSSHDAVLCRQTAPLVELAFKCIANGRGVVILGKDIGKGLVDLIQKQRAQGVARLLEKLDAYLDREVAKFTAKGEEHKADALHDRVNCIRTVVDNLPETNRTVPALIAKLEGLFSDTNGVLTLCTVHKAKGREWPVVAILKPELMPSRWARQEWQAEQEINLQYVAWTRAKHHLIDIDTNAKEGA